MILQREIEKELHIKVDSQRLFFRGKQLENGYKLYDYNINLNDVIQLMVRINLDAVKNEATSSNSNKAKKEGEESESNVDEELEVEAESLYYKIGDAIDCLDQTYGAWFEATILKIFKKKENLFYSVQWEFDDKAFPFNVPESSVRPRARCLIPFDELSVGQKIMINYNVDDPKEVGLWYDFTISKLDKKRRLQQLTGMLHMGRCVYIYIYIICYVI